MTTPQRRNADRAPRSRREFIERIEADGWSVRLGGGGHLLVLRSNGTVAHAVPKTPSDWRSWRNCWSDYQRARTTPPRNHPNGRH